MKLKSFVALLFLCWQSVYAGDVMTLTNGKVFDGKVVRLSKTTIIYEVEDFNYRIPLTDVFTICFEDTTSHAYREFQEVFSYDASSCVLGQSDAVNFHGKKAGHVLLGFLFGPFAVLGTLIASPGPMKSSQTILMSKNHALFSDPFYLQCYKRKAKGNLILMECIGWAVSFAVLSAY